MKLLGNLLWLILGGAIMGLAWWLAGLIAFISIIGIPWGRACFVMGTYTFWPFGKEAINRQQLTGREDIGTGPLGFMGNLLWFVVAGFWLAIGHLIAALCLFVTIIGIPFAIVHLKMVPISLLPIGMTIVDTEVGDEVRRREAEDTVSRLRDD